MSLADSFRQLFGQSPRLFRAPGRINLIGEHTDYNDGFVMPAAIELSCWVAIAGREDRRLAIRSQNLQETAEVDLDQSQPQRRKRWSDYVQGVAVELERSGRRLRGANLLIHSEVPIGSGLSSSAAMEVASALAFLANSGAELDRLELARLCQRAENEFVGARCGVMDQFTACFGQAKHALLLDCRSLEYRALPLPAGVELVICDSGVRHEVAAGEYNTRRAQCEAGVRVLARHQPAVRALRDATLDDLKRNRSELGDVVYRRCRHVVTENARVLKAAEALEQHDLREFGRLMGESHRSMRDDFEISCAELDLLVELAGKQKGVYGARMTGGGFGGCTINLVEAGQVAAFRKAVSQGYREATGKTLKNYVSEAAAGAGEAG
ncbi:MAG TPA: galactokinase [Terriglobales bacterium]|nr:galactokinase [Terriglobales bacterium]